MAYVKRTLAGGEEVLYRARFNWSYDLAAWFWFLLGLSPLFLELAAIAFRCPSLIASGGAFAVAAGAGLLLGAWIWFDRMIRKWTTRIVLTATRLIYKRGLIARRAQEVHLRNIEEVTFHQTLLGRLLGFGVITVRGTGIGVIELPPLARPVEVVRNIEEAQRAERITA